MKLIGRKTSEQEKTVAKLNFKTLNTEGNVFPRHLFRAGRLLDLNEFPLGCLFRTGIKLIWKIRVNLIRNFVKIAGLLFERSVPRVLNKIDIKLCPSFIIIAV